MVRPDPPRGLIVDLITPLVENGDIDGRSLGRLLDRILPHIQGLLLAGPRMGEGNSLNSEQIKGLLERALVVVRGKVPLLVWISRTSPEGTKETLTILGEFLETRQYRGQIFWADAPLYYHSNRGLPKHYQDLASIVKEPFLLYNDPEIIAQRKQGRAFKRSNIRTGILKDLSQIPSIKGLIFRGSLDRAQNYQRAVKSQRDFRIYDGDESRFLKHPSLSGVVSGGANLSPRAWQRITASSLGLEGSRDEYPDHLRQIWETGTYLNRIKDIYDQNPVPIVKQILSDMNLLRGSAPKSISDQMKKNIDHLKGLMKQYGDYPSPQCPQQ